MFLNFAKTNSMCGSAGGTGCPSRYWVQSSLLPVDGNMSCGAFFFRTVIGLHSTWLVNSATHMWGTQRFPTGDTSKNSFWVALLTFGEGWHNNHHAHPQAARHGLAWYEIDLNWYGISALRMLGLAWDVKVPRLSLAKQERETRLFSAVKQLHSEHISVKLH